MSANFCNIFILIFVIVFFVFVFLFFYFFGAPQRTSGPVLSNRLLVVCILLGWWAAASMYVECFCYFGVCHKMTHDVLYLFRCAHLKCMHVCMYVWRLVCV